MITKQQTFYFIIVLLLYTSNAQYKPCSLYLFDEIGCVSSTYEKCSWNDFLSACQQTESTNIGCSPTLNRLACINQLQYPNQDWAYCRFSGYCRQLTDSVGCSLNLSKPACLSVKGRSCQWTGVCSEMTDSQFQTSLIEAQNDVSKMNIANIQICQRITGIATAHQSGANLYINQLIDQFSTDTLLLLKYRYLLNISGCLQVDTNLLSIMTCQTAGLNQLGCQQITNSGEKCVYQNNQCQNAQDFSILNCSDIINKETCLSITNINQPCYWNDGCKLYTGSVNCNTNVSPVSPSFCASINYTDDNGIEQECFYLAKKQKCNQLCRQQSLQNQKSCNSSSFGCTFQQGQCQFSGVKSQCGILGQNKYSCMRVNENCQFFNGICKKITDLSISKCIDNLNQQACQNLTSPGQLCIYDQKKKQCKNLKLDFYQTCDGLNNVNENVCRRITDSACYWLNGNCKPADFKINCNARGLNRIGCLASTLNPCQWNKDAGLCQNVTVITNQTTCVSLKLVNSVACRMVQYLENNVEQSCKYNTLLYQCEKFVKEIPPLDTYLINCSTLGLNKQGCLEVADPTIACKWTSQGCQLLTTITSACSGLINVTPKACALVKGEICAYDPKQFRCTSSVEKNTKTCNIDKQDNNLVINGKACAFIEPIIESTTEPKQIIKCFFDQKNLSCIEATPLFFNLLDCSLSFPNKEACLAISTPGQRCQWNIYKKQCEQYKIPTYDICDQIENAGVNLCIGYENNVQYYIDSTTYCTNDNDNPHKCKQIPETATATDCVFAIKPNLHACVALTVGQDCYFDVNSFECIKLDPANQVTILNTILCKQANEKLCDQITTLDQFCVWDIDEKKCYEKNKCEDAADEAACTIVKQPCGYKNGKCVLITSKTSKDFTCEDANNNEKACMKVSGEVCKFENSACAVFVVQNTDDCSTYSMKVNALSCASIKLDGAQCKYDSINNKCVSQPSVEDECNLGQNEQNCLQENNCQFDSETKVCSKIISPCSGALNLIDCMNVAYYCIWKSNKCGIAPDVTCLEYSQPNIKYNAITCGSVYASDPAKVCVQNPDTQQCEEIVGVKCSSTEDYIDCKNIKNNCKWQPLTANTGKCISNLIKASKCTDNFTQYACLTGNLFCYWNGNECVDFQDQVEILCQTINGDEIIDPVNEYVSQELCFFNFCYLDKTTLKCTVDNSTPTECTEAISPFGCKSLDDSKYCYWDTDSKCKALADLSQGVNLTYRQVSNSQQTLCLIPQNEGELTEWWSGQCYSVDSNRSLCTDILNIRACEAVINDSPKQLCIYKDSKCQYADLNTILCTDTINIYTCVSVTTPNQYCVWLGQKCSNLTDDGFAIGKYPSVNQYSCLKTYTINGNPSSTIQNPLGVKFYLDGCILSDPENDTCDTPGLNYYGCLQTKAGACSWNGSKCVIFTDFNGKTSCSDYKMVSAGVCVQVPQLKCKWDNYNCIDALQNLQCTDSLSEQACISQKFFACKWENNKCQYQTIIPGVTQCGNPSASSTTAPISSIFSCQSVQFGALPCSHQGTGCTTTLNYQTITCNFPGLNDVGCTYVKLEKCQFIDGKCQQYEGNSQQCRQLSQVSPQICADIKELNQNCKYSRLNNKCIQVYNYDLCTSEGINQAGCNSISTCKWHKDQKQCYCSSALIGIKFCADYDYIECQKQTLNCKWDEIIQSCRAIQCQDLNINNCLNSKQNNQICYITTQNNCSGTNNCINAKNAQNCSDITINGLKCSQNGIYCRDQQCEDNLSDVQCNGKCYWTGSYCTKKLCQIFTRKEQCNGTYDDGTCYWTNSQCYGLESCYSLMQIYSNDENLEQNCNKSIINNHQCYWLKAYQYSDDYECTHNLCKSLGSSQINCVGAEINNFVCILAHDFSCIRCEDLTNQCECGKYKGNCNYSNNKCNSIQCASYAEQSCALYPEKCIWHSESNLCLIICSKLDQNTCVTRQKDTKQCYWDSKLERCNNGVPSEIIIDTVSQQIESANITITQSSFDIQSLHKLGIILLIILI